MSWSKLGVLILMLVIIFTVSLFGGHFGYTVDGVPKGGDISEAPGILGAISWAWNGLAFVYDMMSFQVDNMPVIINTIFLIMGLVTLFLFVTMFLPGGSG